jgi:hypothetical protein
MATAATTAPATAHCAVADHVFLTAQWRALAVFNWEIDPELLVALVPRGTELDLGEGKTYISLVGFLFRDARVLGLSIPWHRHFEEVNLRFYVKREHRGELRRAVCFVREVAPRWAVGAVARWIYNEQYVCLPMRHRHVGFAHEPGCQHRRELSIEYGWRWCGQWLSLGMEVQGELSPLLTGTHPEFIAEHYWGYCRQRDGGTVEYRVEHPPWNIWLAERTWVSPAIAQFYPPPFRDVLLRPPTSAFLADGSPVRVFHPRRIA